MVHFATAVKDEVGAIRGAGARISKLRLDDVIFKSCARALSKPISVPTSSPPRETSPPRKCCGVWVVDDSPLQLEACRCALATQFELTLFTSGAAAIEALVSGECPQVMVLDWHMPDLSGIEVCRFIREKHAPAHLPVLILTASGSDEHLLDALTAGANDFVRKPVSQHELQARVAGLVRLSALHAELLEVQRRLMVEAEFRERFMGMLAHDLRQPLNTMSLAGQALSLPEGEAGRLPSALAMHTRACQRMKRMIDELLDFTRSRPDTGMPIQRQATDLAEIARRTAAEMRPGWPRHEIAVYAEHPCVGAWDADRLAQVCSNLIGNALEHSAPSSRIEIRVSQSGGSAELSVSNEGTAIAPDVLTVMFEPFRRGAGSNPKGQGVGLGLHIVDQIVRAHNGNVVAESNDGQTRFSVTLPLSA